MSVDAASAVCCCEAPIPTSCLSIWQCSMARFRLDYEIGLTTKVIGTTSSGPVALAEVTNTMTGFATYQKRSTAPPLTGVPFLYNHVGPSQFTFFSRRRIRSFFSSPNCQPCGSTYLSSEVVTTGSGSIASTNSFWAWLQGACSSCGCNYPNDPKHMSLLIGGYGSFTVNSTTYNQSGSGFPTSQTFSRYVSPILDLADGCVGVNSFVNANWRMPTGFGWVVSLPTPQQSFSLAFGEPFCSDIAPPNRCNDIFNPCISTGFGPNYNASGCAATEADFKVCDQGAGFVCGCDETETNGCVPTIQTYEKFGIFTATIV